MAKREHTIYLFAAAVDMLRQRLFERDSVEVITAALNNARQHFEALVRIEVGAPTELFTQFDVVTELVNQIAVGVESWEQAEQAAQAFDEGAATWLREMREQD